MFRFGSRVIIFIRKIMRDYRKCYMHISENSHEEENSRQQNWIQIKKIVWILVLKNKILIKLKVIRTAANWNGQPFEMSNVGLDVSHVRRNFQEHFELIASCITILWLQRFDCSTFFSFKLHWGVRDLYSKRVLVPVRFWTNNYSMWSVSVHCSVHIVR